MLDRAPFGPNSYEVLLVALPKFLCWETWLTKNKAIFHKKLPIALQKGIKGLQLLLEVLSHHWWKQGDFDGLTDEELRWINLITSNGKNLRSTTRPQGGEPWKLYFTQEEMNNWLSGIRNTVLFFDGASKGNPGSAGARGVLQSPEGTIRIELAWGIGTKKIIRLKQWLSRKG